MDFTNAARAVAVAASLMGLETPKAPPAPPPTSVQNAQPPLVTVTRIPVAQAQAARDQSFVSKPVGLSSIEAEVTGDGAGEFWIRLRQGGQALAWPLTDLENGARACFPAACYQVTADGGTVTVAPEGGQEGQATFTLDELAAKLFDAAPHAKLSDFVDYAAVAEPGPRPTEGATFWHKDASGAIYMAYRQPDELKATTWLVVINGVYFGVRRDGSDFVFERKAQAGLSALSQPRERRLPGT